MSIKIHPSHDQNKWNQRPQHGDSSDLNQKNGLSEDDLRGPVRLTLWKRSSMSFQGTHGFMVFDDRGRLIFRVDNYSRNTRADIPVLMNGAGTALLTLKPHSHQILSLHSQWDAYRGEVGDPKDTISRVFTLRTPLFKGAATEQAEVFMQKEVGLVAPRNIPDFRIQGSFKKRKCNIIASTGQIVAKMERKRVKSNVLLGEDVFSLVVQPGLDTQLIMAFLVILDRIRTNPFLPFLCY